MALGSRGPCLLLLVGGVALSAACSGSPTSGDAGAPDGGRSDAGERDAGTADAGSSDAGPDCASFGFQVTGASCGGGCGPVTCNCAGAFPRSITACTADGCIVSADCQAVCAAPSLGDAVACTGTYVVQTSDAGPADAGGGSDPCFVGPTPFSAGFNFSVATGDLDGDGKLDLLIGSGGFSSFNILAGDGDGGFGAFRHIPTDFPAGQLRLADMNGDGRLDVVYTDGFSVVVVALQGLDGGFATASVSDAGANSNNLTLALGDLNHDGRTDVVLANGQASTLGIFYNEDAGALGGFTLIPGVQPRGIAVGDFNGDGWPDLLVGEGGSFGAYTLVLLNQHDGGFATAAQVGSLAPEVLTTADFNSDGWLDFAAPSGVWLNDAGAGFSAGGSYVTGGISATHPADLDGDGRVDLATAVTPGFSTWQIAITWNSAQGGLSANGPTGFVSIPTSGDFTVGDFNGDGRIDLVQLDQNENANVWLNTCGDAGVLTCRPTGFACTADAQCCGRACASAVCL